MQAETRLIQFFQHLREMTVHWLRNKMRIPEYRLRDPYVEYVNLEVTGQRDSMAMLFEDASYLWPEPKKGSLVVPGQLEKRVALFFEGLSDVMMDCGVTPEGYVGEIRIITHVDAVKRWLLIYGQPGGIPIPRGHARVTVPAERQKLLEDHFQTVMELANGATP